MSNNHQLKKIPRTRIYFFKLRINQIVFINLFSLLTYNQQVSLSLATISVILFERQNYEVFRVNKVYMFFERYAFTCVKIDQLMVKYSFLSSPRCNRIIHVIEWASK